MGSKILLLRYMGKQAGGQSVPLQHGHPGLMQGISQRLISHSFMINGHISIKTPEDIKNEVCTLPKNFVKIMANLSC